MGLKLPDSIPQEALPDEALKFGLLLGILEKDNGNIVLNSGWFSNPLDELGKLLQTEDRREVLFELFEELLGQFDLNSAALPGTGEDESWFPLKDSEGVETGLYVIVEETETTLRFGIGVRCDRNDGGLQVTLSGRAPLFSVSTTTGDIDALVGQPGESVDVVIELRHALPIGTSEIVFDGARLFVRFNFDTSPDFSILLLNLKLPGESTGRDRELSELAELSGEWVELVMSVLSSQLDSATGDAAKLLKDHLLPLLGLRAVDVDDNPLAGWPSLPFTELAEEGGSAIRNWLKELVDGSSDGQAFILHWLRHAISLLADTGAGILPEVEGDGSIDNPYSAGMEFDIAGTPVELHLTLAIRTDPATGIRHLLPGFAFRIKPADLLTGLDLVAEAHGTLSDIPLAAGRSAEPLPGLDVRIRLRGAPSNGGFEPLISFDFHSNPLPAPLDDLSKLGQLTVQEFRLGITLDAQKRLQPSVLLLGVNASALDQSWPTLDLSAANQAIEGIVEVAQGFVTTQIAAALGENGAGRRLAALAGFLPPAGISEDEWPFEIVASEFASSPLQAIACYHVNVLDGTHDGAPAWRHILVELAGLLADAGVSLPAVQGLGSDTDPWRVTIFDGSAGQVDLVAWTLLKDARPQLTLALKFTLADVPLFGDEVLQLRLITQLLAIDLPAAGECPAPAGAEWLPCHELSATIPGPLQLPKLAGLTVTAERVTARALWCRESGLTGNISVEKPHAEWAGALPDSLTLPDLSFGNNAFPNWDLSPDLGLGLPTPDIDKLKRLFSFQLGSWLSSHGGSTGFSIAGLLGLLPDLPSFSFPDLPDLKTGPYQLPNGWPSLDFDSLPDLLNDPWPTLRLHIGRLFSEGNDDGEPFALPTLKWLNGFLLGNLPDLSLPDLGFSRNGSLSWPELPQADVPLGIRGQGTYDKPWALSLEKDRLSAVELLVWLDPDGPPGGGVKELLSALLPQAFRDLLEAPDDWNPPQELDFQNLLRILTGVANFDSALSSGLAALPSDLSGTLEQLREFFQTSNGFVSVASQQPAANGWNAPAPLADLPRAYHGDETKHPDVIAAALNQIDSLAGGQTADRVVLLLHAPWEQRTIWSDFLTQAETHAADSLPASAEDAHFNFRLPGVQPEQINLGDVTQAVQYYTAALTADSFVSAEAQSQQVALIMARLAELRPGVSVTIVAHSTAGLAARVFVQSDAAADRVNGLITIGTPHDSALTDWFTKRNYGDALRFLERLNVREIVEDTPLAAAIEALLAFLNGYDNNGAIPVETPFPLGALVPSGSQDLPEGIPGLAIATVLPELDLHEAFARYIGRHVQQLIASLDGRPTPTHLGLGLRVDLPGAAAGDDGVHVDTHCRLDLTRIAFTDAEAEAPAPELPRFSFRSDILRNDDWLLGGPNEDPRVRRAEILLDWDRVDGARPKMILHDTAFLGAQREQSILEPNSPDLGFDPEFPALLESILNARTRLVNTDPALENLLELLKTLGIVETIETGYGVPIDAFNAFVAAPSAYLSERLAEASPSQEAFFTEIENRFGFEVADNTLTRSFMNNRIELGLETDGTVSLRTKEGAGLAPGAAELTFKVEFALLSGGFKAETALFWQTNHLGPFGNPGLHLRADLDSEQVLLAHVKWRDGTLPGPLDGLQLFPVLPNLGAELVRQLTRLLFSSFLSGLVEEWVLNKIPAAGPVLEQLGVASREDLAGPWQLGPLDGLLDNPQQWLLQPAILGAVDAAETALNQLDPARVTDLLDRFTTLIGRAAPSGAVALPWDLQLRAVPAADSIQVKLFNTAPLQVQDGNISLKFELTIESDLEVGVGGELRLGYDLPGDWGHLDLALSNDDQGLGLVLSADTNLGKIDFTLLPSFSGWADLATIGANLLPTLLNALVAALREELTTPGAIEFVNRFAATAETLGLASSADPFQIDVVALNAVAADPVGWLKQRFSAALAPTTVPALRDFLSAALPDNISVENDFLVLQTSGGELRAEIGRPAAEARLAIRLTSSSLRLGPILANAALDVGVPDSGPVDFGFSLALAIEPAIALGAVDLKPAIALTHEGGQFSFRVYPLGQTPDADFVIVLVPGLALACEESDGTLTDAAVCLEAFVHEIVLPLLLEMLIDSDPVVNWLNADLIGEVKPGAVLTAAGLLDNVDDAYNLIDFNSLPSGWQVLEKLSGVLIDALSQVGGTGPLIPLPGETGGANGIAPGVYIVKQEGDGESLYGLRVVIDDLEIGTDPVVSIELGGHGDWIAGATEIPDSEKRGGILLMLLHKQEDADGLGVFSLNVAKMFLGLESIGLKVSGGFGAPLISKGGFKLGAIAGRLLLEIPFSNPGALTIGGSVAVTDMGLPFGAGASDGDNGVAASFLSSDPGSSGGEEEAVNPPFSLDVSFVERLAVSFGEDTGAEVWFPIQRSFGPIYVQQIGLRYEDSDDKRLAVLFDGSASVAGLTVGVDDLGVSIPIENPIEGQWGLELAGISITYDAAGTIISGSLLKDVDEKGNILYNGFLLIESSGRTFTAIGSYGEIEDDNGETYTSIFVFLSLPITIGGPPYFFIVGLAGGFGYNRQLNVPDAVGEVGNFPLVLAARPDSTISSDPLKALSSFSEFVPPKRGSLWLAAGLRFTSFELAKSIALGYVALDRGLEIGILGLSSMPLPDADKPLVSLELALKARFSTAEGLLSIQGQLTDNSWLLSKDCRLTGGFAFIVWFERGQFLVTVGGYHRAFQKPDIFPEVPRLGFNWQVSSKLTMKGESYFALTTTCAMAGGRLEAVYESGNLNAWFTLYTDFLISWEPFFYDFSAGIEVGASYRLRVCLFGYCLSKTFTLSLGVDVHILGPKLRGTAHVNWTVISFTVTFGAQGEDLRSNDALGWTQFLEKFITTNGEKALSARVVAGQLEPEQGDNSEQGSEQSGTASQPWQLKPEFVIVSETRVASDKATFEGSSLDSNSASQIDIDIAAMRKTNVTSIHTVNLKAKSGDKNFDRITTELVYEEVPEGIWRYTDTDELAPEANTFRAIVGVRLIGEALPEGPSGLIAIVDLIETGPDHPLPFDREISVRSTPRALAETLAEQFTTFTGVAAAKVLAATALVLAEDNPFAERRQTLLAQSQVPLKKAQKLGVVSKHRLRFRRNAPPQIAPLHQGMAPEPVLTSEVTFREPQPPKVTPDVAFEPKLKAVISQRPEPVQARPAAVRTTVSQTAGTVPLPRIAAPTAARTVRIPGARLVRTDHPLMPRQTGQAMAGSASLINWRLQPELKKQAQAADDAILANGVSLQPGATHLWRLPGFGMPGQKDGVSVRQEGEEAALFLTGDQAVRVTCMDRGGSVLDDREFVPDANGSRLPIPAKTSLFCFSGLGRIPSPPPEPGMGAVALSVATGRLAGVGWQSGSKLLQVGPSTCLARGAVIRLSATFLPRRQRSAVKMLVIEAGEALRGQTAVETLLPTGIDTVAIQFDRCFEGEGLPDQDLSLNANGGTLSERAISLSAGRRIVLLYDLESVDEAAKHLSVSVGFTNGWCLTGVVGLAGPAASWLETLQAESLQDLVEDGPLSPTGQTTIKFLTT